MTKTSSDKRLRNVAVIAHVDHGKTTLIDQLLKQAGVFRDGQKVPECVLDSNVLERERGITILAKNCAIEYQGVKINIIDTPGHADFGGEVERVLMAAEGALLLVDAAEGVLPQTKFVLRKAFACGLHPLVVINKIDRPDARPYEVLNQVFDLFAELGASDRQLDFPHLFACGRAGYARRELTDESGDLRPLLEAILRYVPPPAGDPDAPLKVQIVNLDYNDYVGRIAVGRIYEGTLHRGQNYTWISRDGDRLPRRITTVRIYRGLSQVEVDEAPVGEIVLLSGHDKVNIGDTISGEEDGEPLPPTAIDEPTLTLRLCPNDSPFSGREGKFVTGRQLRERLEREALRNVALSVEPLREKGVAGEAFDVSGRGLLHLSVLIETMRREGYEMLVGKPHVVLRRENGRLREPFETAYVEAPEEFMGKVLELFGSRKFVAADVQQHQGRCRIELRGPSRGLIGLRNRLLNATRGEAMFHHAFCEYAPHAGPLSDRLGSVLIAHETGKATAYSLFNLQDRGSFFVAPMEPVYEGQIVGVHGKDKDIVVNIAKAKHLDNIRSSTKERTDKLNAAVPLTLEEALEFVAEDEWVEVTPRAVRLRKKILSAAERSRSVRWAAKEAK